jgi:hypothetical protein
MDEVWFVLLNIDGLYPKTILRSQLMGFLSGGSKQNSWEGCLVEFTSGPLKGQKGEFSKGKVVLNSCGVMGKVLANTFDLRLAI